MFTLYLENPFIYPNEKHVAELHDHNFLKLLRDTALRKLSDALQKYFKEYSQDTPEEYLKTKCKHVTLIGGFLTKFVRENSDIDITVVLKDQDLAKDLQPFFRQEVNFKPLSENYQYQVNYFCALQADHIVKFKRHGIELLNNDIFVKEVEDIFLDKNMVVVQEKLSKKKLTEYFVLPLQKAISIIERDLFKNLKATTLICDKLKRVYPLLDRVGTKTFPEFSKLPKALTIYEYTQDNLRYKALSEDSEIHKIMVLAQSHKIDELNKYLAENTYIWMNKKFTIENCLERNILDKLK